MASPPVTVCVVAAAGDADVQRTLASVAETGWATEVLPVRDLVSADPNAAWASLLGRTRTAWSLLLLPGEEVGVLREEWLAADLAGEDAALGVVLTGSPMPLPNPFDPGQVRLLRTEARGTSSSVPVTALVVQRPEVVSPLSVQDSQSLLVLLAELTRSRARTATPEELVADAQLLALAGETDGAFVRGMRFLEAVPVSHPLVPTAARLAALAGLATGRAPEASRMAALMSPEEPDSVWWTTLLLFLANDSMGLRTVIGDADAERRRAGTWADLSVALAAAGIERADVVLEAMYESLGPRTVLADAAKLIEQWVAKGRDVEDLVRRWPASAERALLAYLDLDPSPSALGTWLLVAGAYRDTRGLTSSLVKRLVALAPRLTAETALEWSRLLAASSYAKESLVRRQATAASLPEVRRVLAAAIAVGALDDPSGQQVLARLGPLVPEHDFQNLVVAVDVLARPALAEVLVALASTPARARRLADLLRSLGAPDRAVAMDEQARRLEGS
jgi:hypothetical protein